MILDASSSVLPLKHFALLSLISGAGSATGTAESSPTSGELSRTTVTASSDSSRGAKSAPGSGALSEATGAASVDSAKGATSSSSASRELSGATTVPSLIARIRSLNPDREIFTSRTVSIS